MPGRRDTDRDRISDVSRVRSTQQADRAQGQAASICRRNDPALGNGFKAALGGRLEGGRQLATSESSTAFCRVAARQAADRRIRSLRSEPCAIRSSIHELSVARSLIRPFSTAFSNPWL